MAMVINSQNGITFPNGGIQPSAALGTNQTLVSYSTSSYAVLNGRAPNTTYYNNTGRDIVVGVGFQGTGNPSVIVGVYPNGVIAGNGGIRGGVTDGGCIGIVPNGASYWCNAGTIIFWNELR